MKQGIQEFHRKYVLAPADKAANNVVVVWRLYYINTLIQEFGSTKTYERISTDERSIANIHSIDITAKFAVSIKEKQDRLPTLYWLPKLHKRPYQARFITNSNSCTTTFLSKLLTSCLTAVKNIGLDTMILFTKGTELTIFGQLKIPMMFSINLNLKTFRLLNSLHMIFTLYTTLTHHLIKNKLIDLINRTFIRENTKYLACNEECVFSTSDVYNSHNLWSCQKVCDALVYLLDNIFIRFGIKLYRQTIGIPMVTNCAPLVADLFRFCYEIDFMKYLLRKSGWHYWGFQFNFKIPW